ncbi:MAG: DUF2283 domain-containing protein [Chloroflexi bacterium CG_4_9_14_3_um_filter_45_9]|nr:MAG: DUF2283 domain-containing protein [Chloroflexi bacterium CG08_land_8_20_14_0_20_45_12]PIX27735.1 MAG: DUF2283 domain-containing protein [Chloroflexi bacterium CG_4_8_14_3_um_filter_45_15]PJB49002.1 MAG: DUF2283 domain-containing protein [Chloroflexi bacterium CG_4_9_14_3_um_filter_45_9]
MKIKYVKDIDVLSIELQEGEFEYSEEIGEGIIFDIGVDGDILSIEVIDAGKRLKGELVEKVARKYLTEV